MRWGLVVAFCIAAGAATAIGLGEKESPRPSLRVTIHPATPFPDEEDDQNPITSRYWYVYPPFTAEAEERCDRADASSRYQRFFNGEPVPPAEGDDYDSVEPQGRARQYRGEVDGPLGLPGETIRVTLRVKCVRPGQVVTGTATRTIDVPAASCSGGPLRVLALRGRATSEDYEEGSYTLSPGDLVRPGSELDVSPGGELELGAPECNSLRLTFFGGRSTLGGYSPDRRTYSTGRRLLAEGDAHGGGWEDRGRARVVPLAERCLGCGVANGTRYEVRSARRRVTLRVFSGAALLYGGTGRPVRVEDGKTASVLCSAPECAPTRPRFFQDGEPWSTPANLPDKPLRRVVTGRNPPLWRLAPYFSRVSARRLPAAGNAPDQIAVSWSRQVRRRARYGYKEYPEGGFFVWQRVAPSRWRLVYDRRFEFGGYDDVQVGDVTRDGHPDVLVAVVMGSGACGPRRLVAYAGKRTGDLFARDFCEGDAEIVGDALRVRRQVGPCPDKEASAHCGGGFRTTFYRWRGAKLASARSTVRCELARLDPARDCRPKPKRNTP